jgi:hypothetical protein
LAVVLASLAGWTARAAPLPSGTSTAGGATAGLASVPLGVGSSFGGLRVLAPDSAWNVPIDHLPADPASGKIIAKIGNDVPLHPDFGTQYRGAPLGIPYVVVPGSTQRWPVHFEYASESDDVLYPIPHAPPIEGLPPGKLPVNDEADHHLVVIDRDNGKLYEMWSVRYGKDGWSAGAGAVFDLLGDTHRPAGFTSADAAGLPIFPGLVRYDEAVEQGKIEHALRFTVPHTRKAYLFPATHCASKDGDPSLPPMGMRVRLRSSVDVNAFPAHVRPILVALKRYGMFLADNGGALFLSGAPDARWNDGELEQLKRLHGRDFEVVRMGNVTTP